MFHSLPSKHVIGCIPSPVKISLISKGTHGPGISNDFIKLVNPYLVKSLLILSKMETSLISTALLIKDNNFSRILIGF